MTYFPGIIFYIFCSAAVIQIFYILFFYLRLKNHKPQKKLLFNFPPVSVIICAKNEESNLKKNLPLILQQDYPEFEVIVADDNSEDGTSEYLFYLSQKERKLKRVKVGNVNRIMAGKKFALTLGIKAANFEKLILTDADCYPPCNQWLKNIVNGYNDNRQIILGYSGYEKRNSFLNKIIRFETVHTAINYLSFALAGIPYMGVGRNLSYEKHLFFDSGGFYEHRSLPSGDDDLFINKIANRKNTSIIIEPQSFTYSAPKETWSEWREQKTRHLSTAKYYRFTHKFFLGLLAVSHIIFWITGIALLAILFQYWYIIIAVIAFRWLVRRIAFKDALEKLNEPDLKKYIELFDFMQLFFYLHFAKPAMVKTKYKWH